MKSAIAFDIKKGVEDLFKAVKIDPSHHEPNYADHGLVSFTELGLLGKCR